MDADGRTDSGAVRRAGLARCQASATGWIQERQLNRNVHCLIVTHNRKINGCGISHYGSDARRVKFGNRFIVKFDDPITFLETSFTSDAILPLHDAGLWIMLPNRVSDYWSSQELDSLHRVVERLAN